MNIEDCNYNNLTLEELERIHEEENYRFVIHNGRITCAREEF